MMKTKMLTDISSVKNTITPRSMREPRTQDKPTASTRQTTVSITSKGSIKVSEAGRRDAKSCATGSPVVQLAPKSKVATCLTKIHS